MDAAVKGLQLPPAVQGTIALGSPANAVLGIGLLELACSLYLRDDRLRILVPIRAQ
ncbi:MAG: hypothetical protein ABIT20_26380 [Gemmatimonadaceae bacterium]